MIVPRWARAEGISEQCWNSWRGMIDRCHRPGSANYAGYGGRGIKVCRAWRGGRRGLRAFHADMGNPPMGLSLERKNVNQGYSPKNCRWASASEQQANRRKFKAVANFTPQEIIEEIKNWPEDRVLLLFRCLLVRARRS